MTVLANQTIETIAVDAEGYIVNAREWTPRIAEIIAAREGITLTDRHWVVINFARQEFEANGEAPSLRRITKSSGVETREMYQLFPGGPARLAAKIAGLKKPTGCL